MRPNFLGLITRSVKVAVAAAWVVAGIAAGTIAANAQSPFSPALYVNDDPITNYEVTQKMRFLQFLGVSDPDMRSLAIERLIEDRLQLQEGTRLGGRVPPDILENGMNEFASRAGLTASEMIERLQAEGIDRETFETFIRAGILWRDVVRAQYGPSVSITEAQVDQALSVAGLQPVTEVLLSELFLPADPQFADAVQRMIPQVQRIRSETEFANAARQVSAAPSAAQGGRIDRWVNITSLPPELAAAFESAAAGTIVGPLEVPGAYAFFLLRGRRNTRSVDSSAIELDFYRAALPGGLSDENRALVAQMRDQMDACVDFPATVLRAVPSLPDTAVERITQPQPQIASSVRGELERLNPGQISASLVENGALIVMMLCNRQVGAGVAPSRDEVRMSLVNRALEGHAMVYLQSLRADADIRYP